MNKVILIENGEYGVDRKIKKFLFIEDGSVDTDDLGERLASNPEIAIVIYRQGSLPPQLVDIKGENK